MVLNYHRDMTGADLHNPKEHADSHATGGSDAISLASIGAAAASGLTLLDAEVSAHVATSGTDAHLIANISGLSTSLNDKVSATLTKEATGFNIPENVIVSYDGTTRKVTLTGTGWKAYWRGAEVTALTNGWVSAAHSTDAGTYFLYYDGSAFVWGTVPWIFSNLQIALVYRDGVNFCIRECHGLMQWQTHQELHETIGCYLFSGGDISGYTTGSTTAIDRRPNVSSAVLKDEDNPTTLPSLTTEIYTQFTLSSANTANVTVDQAEIIPVTGAQPFYNQLTGGNWVQTGFPVNAYGKVFVVAIPTTADAGCQKSRFLFIQPQTVSTTLATIQSVSPAAVNWGHIAGAIPEFTFIAEIIVRYQSGNWTIISAAKLSGTKVSQVSTSTGLTAVSTDASLTGNGTAASPLSAQTALDAKRPLISVVSNLITDGLIRRYKLDGDALDSVGGYNGTWTGNARYVRSPLIGVIGAKFDTQSPFGYITADDTGLPSGAADRSICFWAQAAYAGASYCPLFCYGTDTTYLNFGFGIWAGTAYFLNILTRAGTAGGVSSLIRNDGLLHHYCITFNGTVFVLAMDGVDVFSGSEASAVNTTLSGTLYLGANTGATYKAVAWMHDWRAYNRVISSAEKLAIYQFGG